MLEWKTMVQPTRLAVRLLILDPEGNEVLKARLPSLPQHPRALLALLEAVAMWAGQTVTAAISVPSTLDPRFGEALFHGGPLPVDSALVRFDVVSPRRRRTLPGVGDFRRLRRMARRSA